MAPKKKPGKKDDALSDKEALLKAEAELLSLKRLLELKTFQVLLYYSNVQIAHPLAYELHSTMCMMMFKNCNWSVMLSWLICSCHHDARVATAAGLVAVCTADACVLVCGMRQHLPCSTLDSIWTDAAVVPAGC
jgi:hypothetical protein